MKSVCLLNKCTGCGACIDICPKEAISLKDDLESLNAVIDENACIHCGMCEKVCQQVNPVELCEPVSWFQGWNNDEEERARSSSGGLAYALAKQILNEKGYVASCVFTDGEFRYALIDSLKELESIQGSKYVKSNPSGIFKPIKDVIKTGKDVLFIGLPCHIAGLKSYIGKDYDNLITVDLICHGSPSQNLLELFLNQYNVSLKDISKVSFRQKTKYRLHGTTNAGDASREISFTEPTIRDKYTISFLKGLTYTENCYECQFAKKQRVSDLTIGDSWGSELDSASKKKGVSLILCQTKKGHDLLVRSGVELRGVDLDNAISSNHQLREPFPEPKERSLFFKYLKAKYSFNRAVAKCYPKLCLKTDIKNILCKLGLYNTGR